MSAGRLEAEKLIAEKVFVLEAFPYAARRRPDLTELEGQKYVRSLLAQEQKRTRPPIIVVGRANDFWNVGPSETAFAACSRQTATISPGNLKRVNESKDIDGSEIFKRIVRAVLE